MWVAPRTPSLKLGLAVMALLVVLGVVLQLPATSVALMVLGGGTVLAVETLNTALEMLCDLVQPKFDPRIGKIKDVAAGATVITEVGVAILVLLLIGPPLWQIVFG